MRKPIATAMLFCLLLLLWLPHPAIGQDTGPSSQTPANQVSPVSDDKGAGYLPYSDPTPLGSGGLFGAIVRTIFSLAVVLGLLYVTLWLIRRFTGGAIGPSSEGAVRVVGRVYLSPKNVVYFLRLADELLVIGVSAGSISLLTSVKDERDIERIEDDLRSARAQVPGPAFSRLFDRSMARFQKPLDREESGFDDHLRTLNKQIGRLKGIARKRHGDEE